MRHVLEDVEPRHALGAQQRQRLRVGLLEDGGHEIARVDLLALGVLCVRERALDHAVERERLAGLDRLLTRLAGDLVVEETRELALELPDVRARVAQHLGTALVVAEREQEVLDRQVGVAAAHGFAHRRLQGELQLAVEAAHSGSDPARRGYPRSSAIR